MEKKIRIKYFNDKIEDSLRSKGLPTETEAYEENGGKKDTE